MSLYFTQEHQWVRICPDNASAIVGISHHAQEALGDIVFVDLPAVGTSLAQLDVGAIVESVKTAADVRVGLSGTVAEINEALRSDPSLANTDPMGAGWFFKIQLDPAMTAAELTKLIPESAYAP